MFSWIPMLIGAAVGGGKAAIKGDNVLSGALGGAAGGAIGGFGGAGTLGGNIGAGLSGGLGGPLGGLGYQSLGGLGIGQSARGQFGSPVGQVDPGFTLPEVPKLNPLETPMLSGAQSSLPPLPQPSMDGAGVPTTKEGVSNLNNLSGFLLDRMMMGPGGQRSQTQISMNPVMPVYPGQLSQPQQRYFPRIS